MNRRPQPDRPHRAGGGGTRPPEAQPPSAARPATYRAHGQLRRDLFDEEAREEADRWRRVKSSQLRRFFGAVTGFVRRLDLDREMSDQDAQVSMALQKASATYAAARSSEHAPIRDFFEHHSRIVKTRQDYRDFARHFEAVVAYHRALAAENSSRED